MLSEASKEKLLKRIKNAIKDNHIWKDITYCVHDKDGVYQCIIRYYINDKWKHFWATTGISAERGNQRNANKVAKEIVELFQSEIDKNNEGKEYPNLSIIDFRNMVQLNTTNFDPNVTTKADWDFYDYMEYWLNNIIKHTVQKNTFVGYKRNVEVYTKEYFTMKEHKKTVKEITVDDLDEFFNFLRTEKNLKDSSIDHYKDNISSAFKSLLRKKLIRYNPIELTDPLKEETVEVSVYNSSEILDLFDVLEDDPIYLPSKFASYYGLRRSEILGIRIEVLDLEKDYFTINHVALQDDSKDAEERVYFLDKTKSKKGTRTLPIFPEIKKDILNKIERIEKCKEFYGNTYNHKYDGYLFVHDNGDFILPNYFTKRFGKIIRRNKMKKVTPHGLRHSNATLLHMEGVDIRDLQDWLGHQSIASTNRYTRSDYQRQLETGKAIERIFGKERVGQIV